MAMIETNLLPLGIMDIRNKTADLGHFADRHFQMYIRTGLQLCQKFLPLHGIVTETGRTARRMSADECAMLCQLHNSFQHRHLHARHVLPKVKHAVLHLACLNLSTLDLQ